MILRAFDSGMATAELSTSWSLALAPVSLSDIIASNKMRMHPTD
jgi:hypothetical protein